MEENEEFQKEKLHEDYNDSYWEQHYTICRERIPVFLERVANKVLNTGKYLNVVRQCGQYCLFHWMSSSVRGWAWTQVLDVPEEASELHLHLAV